MNLHEYQAKQLLAKFNLPIPKGIMVTSVEQALLAAHSLNGDAWVVKAQVHAGGRGKAGGIQLVRSASDLEEAVKKLLHSRLVTQQTGAQGKPIHQLLIEEPCDIAKELYVGVVIDRSLQKVIIMVSNEGGVEIEKIAENSPEKILKLVVDPFLGVLPYQGREISLKLCFDDVQAKQFMKLISSLYKMFIECDLSLIEINPLVLTKQGQMLCLDAKINVDDNALYRQTVLRDMRDTTQEDKRELHAREWELNYIPLEGDIGCMVNGAGLAMATMDLIKLHDGNPANFLDVGGGATAERVQEAFKIISSDQHVKAVLVNIFGGIVRCDLIAQGIITAVAEVGIKVPVVVRLEGNHAAKASDMLNNSDLNIIAANTLNEAAEKVVKVARETL